MSSEWLQVDAVRKFRHAFGGGLLGIRQVADLSMVTILRMLQGC